MNTPATQTLQQLGLPFHVFRHTGEVSSLEQAASERGQKPGQVVRSLLFRLPGNQFVLVLVAGPAQVSWVKLRAYLNTNRVTTATPAEVLEVTGYPVGAVSPFGLASQTRILLDNSVRLEEIISVGSGVRNMAILMRRTDLELALPNMEAGDFTD